MKFVCSRCYKLIDAEEAIIEFADALAVTHILAYHAKCWKKEIECRDGQTKEINKQLKAEVIEG